MELWSTDTWSIHTRHSAFSLGSAASVVVPASESFTRPSSCSAAFRTPSDLSCM